MKRHGSCRRAAGFTYLALLFLIAMIGLAASASVQMGAVVHRREAEEELLHVGLVFKRAIGSYAEQTAENSPTQQTPKRLEDLVRDPRTPFVRRHLRRIYADPLTGKADWGLIYDTNGGIIGVYSLSKEKPVRVANFPDEFFYFTGKPYSQWHFVFGVPCTETGCQIPPQPARLQ